MQMKFLPIIAALNNKICYSISPVHWNISQNSSLYLHRLVFGAFLWVRQLEPAQLSIYCTVLYLLVLLILLVPENLHQFQHIGWLFLCLISLWTKSDNFFLKVWNTCTFCRSPRTICLVHAFSKVIQMKIYLFMIKQFKWNTWICNSLLVFKEFNVFIKKFGSYSDPWMM